LYTARVNLGHPARIVAGYLMLGAELRRRVSEADELRFAWSSDGWRLALHRYLPAARGARRHPVILCHGLASNRVTFDLDAEVSLARRLASLGYDVFSLELRAHGASAPARLAGPFRWGFSFDDYLTRDVPAAIGAVRSLTGAPRVHWIGHSMGGILLYAHLACGGAEHLASGVAVGSALDYSWSASAFHSTLRMRRLGALTPFLPIGAAMALMAPWTGLARPIVEASGQRRRAVIEATLRRALRGLRRQASRAAAAEKLPGFALERFNLWPDNVAPRLVRRLHARAFHSVSTPVLLQLASAFEPGGLRSCDLGRCYLDDLRAAAIKTPVLAVAGDRDLQCPIEAATEPLLALAGRRKLEAFGLGHGHSSHYGHFDLLIGRRARHEVWPAIESWLHEHD
jgi:pimeloyl-ACP methyl ester carboxylesterase